MDDPWFDFVSKMRVEGEVVLSDNCIWCNAAGEMSKSHIIPEAFGSHFEPRITCTPCNNYLGTAVEPKAWENAYIQAALAKLQIVDRRRAYRKGTKTDNETGFPVTIDKYGRTSVIPGPRSGGGFLGTPRQQMEYHVAQFKKSNPTIDTKPMEDFFRDNTRTRLEYCDVVIEQKLFLDEKCIVKVEAKRSVNPYWMFKLVYETLSVLGFYGSDRLRRMCRCFVRAYPNQSRGRILFSSLVEHLVLSEICSKYSEVVELETIPFENVHFFSLHISIGMILYMEIVLFNQIRALVILGPWDWKDDRLNELLDVVFYYPDETRKWRWFQSQNIGLRGLVDQSDRDVDYRCVQLVRSGMWHKMYAT